MLSRAVCLSVGEVVNDPRPRQLGLTSGVTSGVIRAVALAVLLAGGTVAETQAQSVASASGRQPNIVHIFVDDLGKGSLGIYGQNARAANGQAAIRTPHLDALAGAGITMERAYAATLCSPSRSMLQLGFHQGHADNDRNVGTFHPEDVTVAEMLGPVGYQSAIFGKWGFGGSGGTQTSGNKEDDLRLDPSVTGLTALPNAQGFDTFTGYLNHSRAHRFFTSSLWTTEPTGNPVSGGLSELMLGNVGPNNTNLHSAYTHDVVAAASEQYVRAHAGDEDPFYLQVNYTIPHNDLEAIQFVPGWFDDYAGVNTSDWTHKERYYAAMITRMDASVGALMAQLEDPNGDGDTSDSVMADTIIMFTSDNGATDADFNTAGLDHFGINEDLRGGKRDLWEGGINMPFIARWDGVIEAGSSSDALTDLTDFIATAADLAGARAPVGTDGVSILPTLTGEGLQRQRQHLIFEHHEWDGPDPDGRHAAWAVVRDTDKMIAFANGDFELYDLVADPDENAPLNLASPDVALLKEELQAIAVAEGVLQPASYRVEYATYTGGDQSDLHATASWNIGSAPADSWSAVVGNDGAAPHTARVTQHVTTLGLEVSGAGATQTVAIAPGIKLEGRNEVRVLSGGRIDLQDATLASARWLDIEADGAVSGIGTIKGDLYNLGTLAPGVEVALFGGGAAGPGTGGQVVDALALDFSGVQDEAPLSATSQRDENIRVVSGLDFGPGVMPRNAANAGDEFNVSGWVQGGSLQSALEQGDYLTLTVAPVAGVSMQLESVSVNLWRNGDGAPEQYAILTSLEGFAVDAALGTFAFTDFGVGHQHLITGSSSGAASTAPIEIRVYGWAANGANGNTHFNALSLRASFESVPTAALDPTGRLTLDGDYRQWDSGRLAIELGGADNADPLDPPFDQLVVNGSAHLDGGLSLALTDEYAPGLGARHEILTAESLDGRFATVDGVLFDSASGVALAVTYEEQAVIVTAAIPGDFNLDGEVGLLDLDLLGAHWQTQGAGWAQGDVNGDGAVTLLDLDQLGQYWGAGSAGEAAGQDGSFAAALAASGIVVPEPTAAGLLLGGVIGLTMRP